MKSDSQWSESELIDALRRGQHDAFHQLVSCYHNTLVNIAKAIVGDAFADEVVQDSWEAIISAIHNFEGRASLRSWLISIVSNRAKTRLKREKRHQSLDDGWQNPDAHTFNSRGWLTEDPPEWNIDTPEALLASEQLRDRIVDCLESLPEKQRAVLRLYDIEGLDFDDICDLLEVSSSNVRVLLHRARISLRHVIAAYQQLSD